MPNKNTQEATHLSRMLLHAISETNDPILLHNLLNSYKDREGVHPSVLKFGYAKLELMGCRDLMYTQKENAKQFVRAVGRFVIKFTVLVSSVAGLAWLAAQIF